MAALCKVPTKSAGIGLSIMAVCKNVGKKTLGHDDFFVVIELVSSTWPTLCKAASSSPLSSMPPPRTCNLEDQITDQFLSSSSSSFPPYFD